MEKSATISIESLKTYREGKRLEVKSAKGGLPNSLWETYSAFANSDGGVIVLGVKESEDGSLLIEGLKDVHKLLKDFWNMVNNRQNAVDSSAKALPSLDDGLSRIDDIINVQIELT